MNKKPINNKTVNMTITEILTAAKVSLSTKDKSQLGHIISLAARTGGIVYVKKPEQILVNDYPAEFVPAMEEAVINFLMDKAGTAPVKS